MVGAVLDQSRRAAIRGGRWLGPKTFTASGMADIQAFPVHLWNNGQGAIDTTLLQAATRCRVEVLIDAYRADSQPDRSTAAWVAKLPDDLYRKLAKTGLVVPRAGDEEAAAVPMLEVFIDRYIEKRKADTNPGTRINYGQAKGYLVKFLGQRDPSTESQKGTRRISSWTS